MHRYTLKILGKLSKSVTFNATLNTHLKDKVTNLFRLKEQNCFSFLNRVITGWTKGWREANQKIEGTILGDKRA